MDQAIFSVGYTRDFLDANGRPVYRSIGKEVLDQSGAPVRTGFLVQHEPTLSPGLLGSHHVIVSLTPRITRGSLAGVTDLLAISRFGVGYDMVDVQACTEADVVLCITRGAVDHSVAEAIVGWMLQLGHRAAAKDRLVREGRWTERAAYMGGELRGRTLGIVGFGGIGSKLAKFVQVFGMERILVFDPYVDEARALADGVLSVPLAQVCAEADYVSINCPLNDETRQLVGERELRSMKPTAFLVNTARGGIVNEPALCKALEGGWIAGAALDVYEEEPIPPTSPLLRMDNVILAPHCIAWTDDLFSEIGRASAQQVLTLCRGEVPGGVVNPEVLDRPGFLKKLRHRQSLPRATR